MNRFCSFLSRITVRAGRPASCLAFVFANIANAQSIDLLYSPTAMLMLPSYCKHTLAYRGRVPGGNDQQEVARWYKLLGPTFEHMHHYCWALAQTNHAMFNTRSSQERNSYLVTSIGDFDYVIRNAPADFPLLPEILTRKGENLLRITRTAEGTAALFQAIEIKPDYWPPYSILSDHYKEQKNFALARSYLEKGLSAAPDAKPLQQRLRDLPPPKH